jgi:hypothetical protein
MLSKTTLLSSISFSSNLSHINDIPLISSAYVCKQADDSGRALRHEPSSPAQTQGSWVRIRLEAWMSVCIYSVFVLSNVQVVALRRADPRPRNPTDCVYIKILKKLRRPQGL